MSGRKAEARDQLARMEQQWRQKKVGAYNIAAVYAALGDHNQAFAWLDRAFDDRTFFFTGLKIDPDLDSLHSDPRFQALVGRIQWFRFPGIGRTRDTAPP